MRRYEIPSNVRHRYRLIRPHGKSKNFRIQKLNEGGDIEAIKSESLEAVNAAHLDGRIPFDVAEKECQLLIDGMYRSDGALVFKEVSNVDNFNLIERFFTKEVRPNPKIRVKGVAWSRLRSAVECLGAVSLLTGTQEQIQKEVDDKKLPPNVQRRRIASLLQLLRWLKRYDVKLYPQSEDVYDIVYIPPDEFQAAILYLPTDALRCMAEMAYHTGCRAGELLALEKHSMRTDGIIHVTRQLLRTGKLGPLKSQQATFKKEVFALRRAVEIFPSWVKLKHEITPTQRLNLAHIMRKACEDAKVTSVKFHQLRHGYAITLASMGFTLSDVASSMGIREDTVKTHYQGYIQTKAMSARLRAIEDAFVSMQGVS